MQIDEFLLAGFSKCLLYFYFFIEKWKCTVHTSDIPDCGTDAEVSLVAYGDKGMSKVMVLTNGQTGNFEPGKMADFEVSHKMLMLRCVGLFQNLGLGPVSDSGLHLMFETRCTALNLMTGLKPEPEHKLRFRKGPLCDIAHYQWYTVAIFKQIARIQFSVLVFFFFHSFLQF